MFCAKCGVQNADANKFCMGCGAPLAAAAPSPLKLEMQESTPQPTQVNQPSFADNSAAVKVAVGKVCPLCALSYPATQKFCNADGASLVLADAASVAKQVAPDKAQTTPALRATAIAATKSSEEPPKAAAATPPISTSQPLGAPTLQQRDSPSASALGRYVPPPVALAEQSQSAPSKGEDGLACPKCGLHFPAGVRFCDQDGTTLVDRNAVSSLSGPQITAPSSEPDEEPVATDWSNSESGYGGGYGEGRSHLIPALIAGLLVVVAAGAGYAYWTGELDKWLGNNSDPSLIAPGKVASGDAAPKVPVILGSYKAHIADQDIQLTISGGSPKPLVSSSGTMTYLNIVNGGTCTASLIPTRGGGVGGDLGNAVSFQQSSVPGKLPCPQDIPVRMDITGQPIGADGVVRTIKVEWPSPDSTKVLMAGKLEREGHE